MQDTQQAEEIKIGRRQLMVGASLAGVIATMPEPTKAQKGTDPHVAWFEAWKAADIEACDGEEDIDTESEAWRERTRLGTLIANTVAQTPAGIRVQWQWLDADFGYVKDSSLGYEYANFFNVLAAGFDAVVDGGRALEESEVV